MPKPSSASSPDVDIRDFLRGEGLDTPESQARGRSLLQAHALTHEKKKRMSSDKLGRARRLLACLTRVCDDDVCRTLAEADREQVSVRPRSCSVCRGSESRRWCVHLSRVLREAGISQCLVVGGTPVYWDEMKRYLENPKGWRIVDGTQRAPRSGRAKADQRWCDLCIIWAPSPLRHTVSNQYKDASRRVTVTGRSIKALCRTVIEHVAGPLK
jgi:hypothetical protein